MKTTITIGRSVQVIQMGQPEEWWKFGIDKDFPEDVNIQTAIADLVAEINTAVVTHCPKNATIAPKGDLYFNVSKGKEERG